MSNDGYFQRSEGFDVVLVKKDVNALAATPGDFKRIPVQATEPGVAGDDPEVVKAVAAGYRQVEVVGAGKPSDHETMARSRASDAE